MDKSNPRNEPTLEQWVKLFELEDKLSEIKKRLGIKTPIKEVNDNEDI